MNALALVKVAWRNLWRQRRRTLLTLVSIAFGAFLSVLVTAMEDRSFTDFIDNAARLGSGHVTFQQADYQDSPTLAHSVDGADEDVAAAVADRSVAVAVERITSQAMVSTASDSFGAFVVGYDPTTETKDTLQLLRSNVDGQLFERRDDRGIVLGRTLAHNLGAGLGDKVVYTLTDRHGQIVTGMERVKGIATSGAPSLDAALVLLPIDTLRALVGYGPHEATQVAVFLKDGREAPAVRARLASHAPAGVSVLTWDEIQPEIRAFVAMKIGGSLVIELIIGLLIAAGIFNTLFMSVLERSRELGILIALGYSPRQLFGMVMAESGILSALGLLSAALVTAWPYHYLHTHGLDLTAAYAKQGITQYEVAGVGLDPIMRVEIFPEHAALIAASIVGATLLAGLYPAWKAGRVDPVESIQLV